MVQDIHLLDFVLAVVYFVDLYFVILWFMGDFGLVLEVCSFGLLV